MANNLTLTLDNQIIKRTDHYEVMVVGCGGTGSFVAEDLCRVLPEYARPVLVDMDIVEEQNLRRQNFLTEELGEKKSEALARRLAREYDRPVGYVVCPIGQFSTSYTQPVWSFGERYDHFIDIPIVVGCVDNGCARLELEEMIKKGKREERPTTWWIDSGNGENFGQVLIGNASRLWVPENWDIGRYSDENICYQLPLPTLQRPDLLKQEPAFAACEDRPEQGPTINRVMASIVVETVRRLIVGTLSWAQVYVDMEAGTMNSVVTTQDMVNKLWKETKEVTNV